MYTVNGYNIFTIVFVTFLTTIILVPLIKKIATHVGAIDYPNERRINKVPMPTMGGLAIFFSFMLGYMLYARSSTEMLSILMGSFIVIFMGLLDDIKPLGAKIQLAAQLVASCIIVFYGGITIDELSILGHTFTFLAPWNYLITIFLMITIINTINLSDGLDGLCSGISSIYFLTIAIIAFILNQLGGLDVTLALIMLGATLGFLVYNFPPAKIYLGDTGSNFLGFMIVVIALLGFKTAAFTSLIIPLVILATPFIDVAFSVIRRILKKQNPFTHPDKQHLHHQLLKMKFSTRTSLLIIYFMNILFAGTSILYALGETKYSIIIYVGMMLLFLFIVLKTDILFKREGKKDEKNKN